MPGWILAAGEGRRVGGQDKGLLAYQGRALAAWVLDALGPQTSGMGIGARRHLDTYRALLQAHTTRFAADNLGVHPDAPDLPEASGPLAGIVTALRSLPATSEWVMVVPCDTPHLPADLVSRLHAAVLAQGADVAVPCTPANAESKDGGATDGSRYHWVCALVHRRVLPRTEALFATGERRVGVWVRSLHWCSALFTEPNAFDNMNTLETLHGRA